MNYYLNFELYRVYDKIEYDDIYTFFSLNRYSNIYIFDGDKYLGWINCDQFIEKGCRIIIEDINKTAVTDFNNYIDDHYKIASFLELYPGVRRIPIINNGELVSEFSSFDSHKISFSTQKKMNALSKLSVYQNEINEYLKSIQYNKIGIVCPDGYDIPKSFTRCTISDSGYDIILNAFIIDEIVDCVGNEKVVPLDEVMFCALVYEMKSYRNIMSNLYFFNEPIIEKLDLYYDEIMYSNYKNDISAVLSDDSYKQKVYENYPDDLLYLNNLGKEIHHSVIVRYNGVFYYVSESKIKDDFIDGRRVTPSIKHNKNKIRLYGPCTAYSLFTSKESSLAEFLQRNLNEMEMEYDVYNMGIPNGGDLLNDLIHMIYTDINEKDINILINRFSPFIVDKLWRMGIQVVPMTDFFEGNHYWFFNENMHFSPKGNLLSAKGILKFLRFSIKNNCNIDLLRKQLVNERYYLIDNDVEIYKKYLLENKFQGEGRIGFIEMNASPFTNGHAYLIDYARGDCDFLYVFVTEDNPTAFPFYDRFMMIKEYCENYSNVRVLTASDFIGSKYTISAYYNKKFNMKLNATEDIYNFEHIYIPILNIDVRYMGEENHSKITEDLNNAYIAYMNSVGKELRVVKRLQYFGTDISASTIRKKLYNNEYDDIRQMVPPHVFRYLTQLQHREIPQD